MIGVPQASATLPPYLVESQAGLDIVPDHPAVNYSLLFWQAIYFAQSTQRLIQISTNINMAFYFWVRVRELDECISVKERSLHNAIKVYG
jgi:hypothetical protein